MFLLYLKSVINSSNALAIIISQALTSPEGILDHTVVDKVNKKNSHNMMIEAWINKMIEDTCNFIDGAKEICGKVIVQVGEIAKELGIRKEQKVAWQ